MIVIISHPEKVLVFPLKKKHNRNRNLKIGKSIVIEQFAYEERLKVNCKKLLDEMQEIERTIAGHY